METEWNSSALHPTHRQGAENQMGQAAKSGSFCSLVIRKKRKGAVKELGVTQGCGRKGMQEEEGGKGLSRQLEDG